ncbi:MAG: ATP synthase F0 subunit B [Flavobacteriaceae bacterium]|uniref:F0F1 ATP synthase subunit B n=1 Tax=Winogradskyella sp. SYSU M77433 TaxID=3042722 RepID=UPI000C524677|nr:F0F1 ATP synthase subunit B [Winogradskyella sp. SYSU M77433]MAX70260.1 ATP synthase F0 subunit B [Flavobacteriaceae bacterium]MAX71780.1 ATP synthase F0 subunit B [Flavobacteriaceae bacterium]MDH7913679.1 F0F1 ATP synthase subunit B [Winogradskyella sp. SYSU M77433]|tara:strand:+ start:13007 stop:13507 length:501 start_codon:yes stop_codon:yes gene_type:complete
MDKLLNDFSPGLFVVQTILLLLLIFLMVKFAWKPILNSLNEREEGIQGALDAAENAKKEMENLQADNQKLLQEARLERETMLKEARELKTKMIADAEEEAQAQAGKIIAQAQEAIESEKKAAMAELKSHVAGLSLDIAEKVVRGELSNKDKQIQLVESMLGEATLN